MIVPEHLKSFWQLYNKLLRKGWFDKMEAIFTDNREKMPEMIREYGIKLIHLLKTERSIKLKHEYYIALARFTDFLAGELGKKRRKLYRKGFCENEGKH
jgi:hypothetical protein